MINSRVVIVCRWQRTRPKKVAWINLLRICCTRHQSTVHTVHQWIERIRRVLQRVRHLFWGDSVYDSMVGYRLMPG
jgi:hypothetical protein